MTVVASKAKIALARIVRLLGTNGITKFDVRRHGLQSELRTAMRAGLIQSAGYETTVSAEDWLSTPDGRRALGDVSREGLDQAKAEEAES